MTTILKPVATQDTAQGTCTHCEKSKDMVLTEVIEIDADYQGYMFQYHSSVRLEWRSECCGDIWAMSETARTLSVDDYVPYSTPPRFERQYIDRTGLVGENILITPEEDIITRPGMTMVIPKYPEEKDGSYSED